MLHLTFGTDEDQARAIAGIRAIHTRVHGTLAEPVGPFPAGTRYSAEDPALLLWVHASLIESIVLAYEALIAPLSDNDRDTYCRESGPVAIALGARPEDVPDTWAGLSEYVRATLQSPNLAVGRDGHAIARALLSGGFTAATGPIAWGHRLITIGWLPSSVRALYGFEWNERRERQCQQWLRTLRRARRMLPDVVARWGVARARG
jgi:uncharacterized protein (DUF2236 family)